MCVIRTKQPDPKSLTLTVTKAKGEKKGRNLLTDEEGGGKSYSYPYNPTGGLRRSSQNFSLFRACCKPVTERMGVREVVRWGISGWRPQLVESGQVDSVSQ